jgi:hypothetical protein
MLCERCSRGMEWAAERACWVCPHCYHRSFAPPTARASATGLKPAAPAEPPAAPIIYQVSTIAIPPPAPAPAPPPPRQVPPPAPVPPAAPPPAAPPPQASPPASVPAPLARHLSPEAPAPAPVALAPARRWPIIAALSLAGVALIALTAVLLRGHGSHRRGANQALIARVLPADAASVRGVHWSSLGRGKLGRALSDLFTRSDADWLGELRRACKEPVEEAVDWVTAARPGGDRLGDGTVLWGLQWDEDRVNHCVREYAAQSGRPLRVRIEGNLRIYELSDTQSFVAAWLDRRTVAISSSWDSVRQRSVLEEVAARTAPLPGNEDIDELLEHVDTGATLWAVVRRPTPRVADPFRPADPGAPALPPPSPAADDAWLNDEVAALLGARPDALYASADIGDAVHVDAGARYASEDKAARVAHHVQDYLRLRRGAPASSGADLSAYPPAVRAGLERMLARRGGGSALRQALLEAVKVDQRGRYVIFTLTLSAADVDRLLATAAPRDLFDEVNGWLPDALKLAP